MVETLTSVTGKRPTLIWHSETSLPENIDLIAIPGGFSYGDYLRSGAIAARSPIMSEVIKAAARGVYILGVCNGFQILTESGLLPGVLMRNKALKFICKDAPLTIANNDTAFTRAYQNKEAISIPVAHMDGNYLADEETRKRLKGEGRVAFYYQNNLNGSADNIAGIFSKNHRILGMMPHPERAVDPLTGGTDGRALFESLLQAV
jgi:phosphoribosylformylglycinamidine synthase